MTRKTRRPQLDSQQASDASAPHNNRFRQGQPSLLTSAECENDEQPREPERGLADFGERMQRRPRHRRSARGGSWIEDAFGSFLTNSETYRAKSVSRPRPRAELREAEDLDSSSPPSKGIHDG